MTIEVTVAAHPLLDAGVFATEFSNPLGSLTPSEKVPEMLSLNADAPFSSDDATRKTIRDLLRHGGFKPTGRNKPASEYLIKAVQTTKLGSINLAVDILNAVSLHSGLPISVVDLDLVRQPLRIGLASANASFVFNTSSQEIKIGGLLCLFDQDGPCANAVKDSQRTKTTDQTTHTLSVVWGSNQLSEYTASVTRWYRELLEANGARTLDVVLH